MTKKISDYMSIDSLYTIRYKGYYIHCHYDRTRGKGYARCIEISPRYYSLDYLKAKIRKTTKK